MEVFTGLLGWMALLSIPVAGVAALVGVFVALWVWLKACHHTGYEKRLLVFLAHHTMEPILTVIWMWILIIINACYPASGLLDSLMTPIGLFVFLLPMSILLLPISSSIWNDWYLSHEGIVIFGLGLARCVVTYALWWRMISIDLTSDTDVLLSLLAIGGTVLLWVCIIRVVRCVRMYTRQEFIGIPLRLRSV